ncbi:hypothetical protein ACLB2K_020941 [Fragaria x ananassa]
MYRNISRFRSASGLGWVCAKIDDGAAEARSGLGWSSIGAGSWLGNGVACRRAPGSVEEAGVLIFFGGGGRRGLQLVLFGGGGRRGHNLFSSVKVGVQRRNLGAQFKSYLPLAPEFYKILVDSKNNWVLIKVLKIFVKLAPLEPRLAKRVVEPICEHIRKTGVKSLLFECIKTVVSSLSEYENAVRLAVVKIREMLVDDDPNLKYLGLQALAVVAPKHLWAVLDNKEVVIKSLSDVDPNIKLESLRLVMAMMSENNVAEICRVLVNYALKSDPEFCNLILGSILSTCCRNVYEIIMDFDWYVSLMGEMSRIPHCQKGEEIEKQLVDIGLRVKDVRPELVRVNRDLLIDPALLATPDHRHVLLSSIFSLSLFCAPRRRFCRRNQNVNALRSNAVHPGAAFTAAKPFIAAPPHPSDAVHGTPPPSSIPPPPPLSLSTYASLALASLPRRIFSPPPGPLIPYHPADAVDAYRLTIKHSLHLDVTHSLTHLDSYRSPPIRAR